MASLPRVLLLLVLALAVAVSVADAQKPKPGKPRPKRLGKPRRKVRAEARGLRKMKGRPHKLQAANNKTLPQFSADDYYFWPGYGIDSNQSGSPLTYFEEGPVMKDPVTVWPVYVGNWTEGAPDTEIIQTYLKSLSNDSVNSKGLTANKWWKVLNTYKATNGQRITKYVRVGAATYFPEYSYSYFSDAFSGGSDDIFGLASEAATQANRKPNKNDIYLVMTDPTIWVGYFCGWFYGYCAYHQSVFYKNNINNRFQYIFVGNTDQCPYECNIFTLYPGFSTPFGVSGVEGMITLIAYELAAAVSNPAYNLGVTSFYSPDFGEAPSLCAYIPEGLKETTDGAIFDIYGVDDSKFLVQSIPNYELQYCVMA